MFQCDRCGGCCRNLKKSDLYAELDRGDGVCKYLDGNLCSIYDERPLLCRVEESYEAFFSKQMTIEEYYDLNYQICEKIKNNELEG